MNTAVRTVGICVLDQEEALRFPVDVLGFETCRDHPMGPGARWIEVAPTGGHTSCGPFAPPGVEHRICTFTSVVLKCDAIEAAHRTLSGRGVTFTTPPARQPWGGMMAQFTDPKGNGCLLVETQRS